jgi:1,2-diacylglycerol 3-alpha-glucosyltransferase
VAGLVVAHFCDSEPSRADGVAASVGLTVGLLRSAGYQVHHYYPHRLNSVAVPTRKIRFAVPWFRASPADRLDLVHVHTTGPVGMAGFRLAEKRGLPLVMTWHTDLLAYAPYFPEIPIGAAYCAARLRLGWHLSDYRELTDRGGRRRSRLIELGRAFFRRTSLVIAPSEKTAAGLTEIGELPLIRTIPTPVVAPALRPAGGAVLRAELGLPVDQPVVLAVGRVTPEKNPDLLLRAFAALRDRLPYAWLVMVGAQQGRAAIRTRIRELGLTERVRLVPPVPRDQVGAYYRMASVLAFASTTDTQSLVLAEAEAAGLPVVVADAELAGRPGAALSVTLRHRTPGDRETCAPTPESMAGALLRMLTDEDLRERTRRAGLLATAEYPPSRYLSLLIAAYEEARAR